MINVQWSTSLISPRAVGEHCYYIILEIYWNQYSILFKFNSMIKFCKCVALSQNKVFVTELWLHGLGKWSFPKNEK